jgi:hypothetical protein
MPHTEWLEDITSPFGIVHDGRLQASDLCRPQAAAPAEPAPLIFQRSTE